MTFGTQFVAMITVKIHHHVTVNEHQIKVTTKVSFKGRISFVPIFPNSKITFEGIKTVKNKSITQDPINTNYQIHIFLTAIHHNNPRRKLFVQKLMVLS
jgi:hypothetical protein